MNIDTHTLKLLALAALVIGAVVRAVKSDTLDAGLERLGLPPVPKLALPWLAVGLGVLGGVVDAFRSGTPWQGAIVEGLLGALAGTTAVAGHQLVIESLRGGREMLAGKASDGRGTGGGGLAAVVVGVALMASVAAQGCSADANRRAVNTGLATIEVLCVIAHGEWSDVPAIMRACGLADNLRPLVEDMVSVQRTASRTAACSRADAGPQ